jgi:hypothetical protein
MNLARILGKASANGNNTDAFPFLNERDKEKEV